MRRIGDQKGASPAEIALAWLLAQRPWIAPIPGITKLHRLQENVRATGVELTGLDLLEVERVASDVTIQGDRYPEVLEKMTNL